MDFAVVRIAGKQYLVKPNQKLEIEGNIAPEVKEYSEIEVLMSSVGDKLEVGTPVVSGLSLKASVISTGKGDKIRVSKFRAKSRYRKTIGFRPYVTMLQFSDFGTKQAPSESKTAEKKATKKVAKN